MKKFILGLAIIFTVIWVYIVFINYSAQAEFIFPFNIGEKTVRTSWVLLCFGLFTCMIDGLSCIWFFKSKTELNKNYQLKMDKLSVQSDSDKTQVKILENKIKTLEAAIEKLTKKDN